jgi:cytochrome P450
MADEDAREPFDDFSRVVGDPGVRSPYPRLAELRRAGPVHRIDAEELAESLADGPGAADRIRSWMPREGFAVVSHVGVSQVLLDGTAFSSRGYAATLGAALGSTLLQLDGPEHRGQRGLIQQAFTPAALARWEADVVAPSVARCVDVFAERGSADLVRELTFPFPIEVIAHLIGIPEAQRPLFRRDAVGLMAIGFDWERGLAASRSLAEMLRPLVRARRVDPADDLIGSLARAELNGARLSDEEICAFLELLVPAGAETPFRASSNLLLGLLEHPDQLDAVRDDRSLIPRAIEEGLRWEAPVTAVLRLSTKQAEVCGIEIPADSAVLVSLASANRDETRYREPDLFNVFREPKHHAAFAFGPHACLGMHLARSESRILLETLFDRLPGLRLEPGASEVRVGGRSFRSPRTLPVRFDR